MKLNDDRAGRLILGLRQQGVMDARVLAAMESIDRAVFVHEKFLDQAWEDQALPIDCAQTISQPYIVGLMTQALDVQPRHRVLEIGTGSGYQAAVLSRLARYVYSIERYRSLLTEAEARLKDLKIDNVITRHGDGGLGWPEQAPFDRIMVTAAAPGEPTELLHQLKPGGFWCVPSAGRRCSGCTAMSARRTAASSARAWPRSGSCRWSRGRRRRGEGVVSG